MSSRFRTQQAIHELLNVTALAGTISVSLLAPNLGSVFAKRLLKNMDRKRRNQEIRRILRYMKKKSLIEMKELPDGKVELSVTEEGKTRLRRFDIDDIKIPIPKKWDNVWRLVLYDIPEEYKNARDELTKKLKEVGFKQMQRSVWVYPFPCHDEIYAITEVYGVKRYVRILEAKEIDNHNALVKRFATLLPT